MIKTIKCLVLQKKKSKKGGTGVVERERLGKQMGDREKEKVWGEGK